MRTDLTLEFADGEYLFKLTVAGLLELQDKTNAGIGELFARVLAGRYTTESGGESFGFPLEAKWHLNDLLETIRLALIGGGVEAVQAKRLVADYCYPAQPLTNTWNLAAAILGAVIEGMPDEEPGKPARATTGSKKKTAPKGSTAQASTQT